MLNPCHTKEKANLLSVKFLNKQTIMMAFLAILQATATTLRVYCVNIVVCNWFPVTSKFSLRKEAQRPSPSVR